jgi:hypothetical protein
VTCRIVTGNGAKVRKCTVQTVPKTVKLKTTSSASRATLSRRGAVFGVGTAQLGKRGRLRLQLDALRRLGPGYYTLTLVTGSGAHERISRQRFLLARTARR